MGRIVTPKLKARAEYFGDLEIPIAGLRTMHCLGAGGECEFTVDASKHGTASLEVGDLARITTRAIVDTDEICHNEDVYYEPLVSHLTHAMPAVASRSSYSGNHLGSTWNESNRRSAFIGTFAV